MLVVNPEGGYHEQTEEEKIAYDKREKEQEQHREYMLQDKLYRANIINTVVKAIMKDQNCTHAEAMRIHRRLG